MNPYPVGQCTWGAANEAPWVLAYGGLGNALDWAANWRARGGNVQMTPVVGAVACFQPNDNQADAVFGHVAVVVSVAGSHFTVSEMNGPAGPGHYDDRACHDDSGVSFLVQTLPPIPPEDDVTQVVIRAGDTPDPLGPGAVYLVKDVVYGPKRHITADGDLPGYLTACGQATPKAIDAYILDRMERGPDIDNSITSPQETP